MKIKAFFLSLIVVFTLGCKSSSENVEDTSNSEEISKVERRVVGYIAGYRKYDFSKMQADKLTHINYAFANIIDGKVAFDTAKIDGVQLKKEDIDELNELKSKNPDLKILVAVGGWTWSGGFSDATLTEESRARLAKSAADFVVKTGLDGIDFDWEFPNQPGAGNIHRPEDKENFTMMLKAVREELDKVNTEYLLTIATNDDSVYAANTELGKIHQYLDFINIMTYDFHHGGMHETGHHANLFSSEYDEPNGSSVEKSVKIHLDAGIPAGKINVGIPFYGRMWKGVEENDKNGLYVQAETTGDIIYYRKIAQNMLNDGFWKRYWDESAKAPYLWNETHSEFISYEDEESIRHKIQYLKKMGLSGVMFWEYTDDYQSRLLDAVHQNLVGKRVSK